MKQEEFYSKLISYIEGTKDFVLDQAPQVFKEILQFDTIISYLIIFAWIIIMPILFYLSFKCYTITYDRSFDRPELHFIIWGITAICLFISAICVTSSIHDIIKIKIAPKYYLIAKIKGGK